MTKFQILLLLLLSLVITKTEAFDRWTFSITPQASSGSYSSSPIREKTSSEGILLNMQYLERDALVLGYFPLQLDYKRRLIPTLHQTTNYISLRDFRTPDALPGILTLRLDGYRINNDDPTHETNDVTVIQPIISFINYAKTRYLDFGYASSTYGKSRIGNGGLHVSQFTPSFGVGFSENTNWIRLRLYDIYASNYIRAQHVTHSNGLEITFSHYILYYPFYIPNRIDAEVFLGNSTYAVDSDAMIVNNLGDVQKNGMYLQANWRLTQHADFLINGGHLNFTTLIANSRIPYALNYIYAGITIKV